MNSTFDIWRVVSMIRTLWVVSSRQIPPSGQHFELWMMCRQNAYAFRHVEQKGETWSPWTPCNEGMASWLWQFRLLLMFSSDICWCFGRLWKIIGSLHMPLLCKYNFNPTCLIYRKLPNKSVWCLRNSNVIYDPIFNSFISDPILSRLYGSNSVCNEGHPMTRFTVVYLQDSERGTKYLFTKVLQVNNRHC